MNALLQICLSMHYCIYAFLMHYNLLQFITSNLNALLHRLSQCTIADNVMYYNSLQAISMHYCIDSLKALLQIPSQCIVAQTQRLNTLLQMPSPCIFTSPFPLNVLLPRPFSCTIAVHIPWYWALTIFHSS